MMDGIYTDHEGNTWVNREGKWICHLKQPLTGITECCEEPKVPVGEFCENCFGTVQPDESRNQND